MGRNREKDEEVNAYVAEVGWSIILWIEIPWPENPENTYEHIRKHWTAISTLLDETYGPKQLSNVSVC